MKTRSIPKIELQQETRPVEASVSLNVTQAAVHKDRWREEITQKNFTLPRQINYT